MLIRCSDSLIFTFVMYFCLDVCVCGCVCEHLYIEIKKRTGVVHSVLMMIYFYVLTPQQHIEQHRFVL